MAILRIPSETVQRPVRAARIVTDSVTGLPMLSAGEAAPILTSEDVDQILGEADDLTFTTGPSTSAYTRLRSG